MKWRQPVLVYREQRENKPEMIQHPCVGLQRGMCWDYNMYKSICVKEKQWKGVNYPVLLVEQN
jgi:hypothetical protein